MGIFTGDLVGILGNDTWQAMGVGSFEAFPLAYNGAFLEDNGGFGYWDFVNKKFVTEDSSTPPLPLAKIGGLVGGVGELFNGQGPGGANLPVDLTGIGEYAAAKVDTYSLFGSEIAGDNDLVASATNNYLLKFGGVRKADGAGGSLLGKGLGLYYRQTAADVYEVGLLSSNLIQATLYPAIGDPANPGMWEIPEDGGSTLLASAKNTVQGSADPPIPNPVHDGLKRPGAIGTAEQKLGDISLESAGYLNQNWGILYGGFGLDQGALPVGSTAIAGGTMIYEGGAEPVTIGYWMGNISNIETLDSYTTGTYVGETIFFDAQNRVFQKGVVNTDPSALGANLVAVNDGNKQVGMTLADYATTPMAFGSMINGSVQQIVNGTLYEKEYEQPYFDGYFRPLGYEYRYFPYPSATANATNGIAFETIEKQMVGSQGTYDDRYHYLYTGNYVGTTSIHYINHLFIGGPTSALDPVPNFTGSSPVSPHFDSSLIVDGTTWFTADKYVKTLSTQWDNVNALVRNVPFQGILGGLPGENLWTATGSDPAQIKLIGTVDPSAQYMTFSGNITGTTDSVSATPTNAYFASIGGTLLGSAGGITPLSGAVIGLFINQDNPSAPKAGFLHGSFSGDAYAGIGMWDGTGGLWVEEKTITGALPEAGAAGLLTPEHPSLFTGVLGVDVNDNLAGSFLDDQNASSGLIQSQIVTLGSTYSIAGQTDWGIFTMTHAMNNTYSNPEGKTAWTSDFAGVAEFGGYLSHDTHWTYRDAGYWKASITDGTWANGWIGGDVAGEFLTHKKYGTLTGQLQGVYTPDTVGGTTGTWQDVIGGAWQKAGDVYFSSAVYGRAYTLRHSQQGGAVYDQGGGINNYYSFYYEDDHAIWPDQYADATYTNNGNQTKTTYRFEMYGMPTSPVYRKNTWTQNMSDGTYTFAQTVYETRDEYLSAMADLANGPEGAVTPYGYYVLGDNSGFYGLMAGVGNLWDNLGSTTATPLRFAGDIDQFDTAERGFSLFAAQVVSFDPLTTLDPFMNSRTPVWNGKSGAYLANLGGIVDNQQNLTGSLQGLYLDDSGNVGIFYGNLTGRHDTALSMWGAEGSAYTYQMNTFSEITGLGLTPENFAGALIIETNMNGIPDPGLAGENVIGADGSAIHLSSLQSTKIKLPSVYGSFDPNWRVEQTLLGGTYAGKPSSWTWTFNSPTAGPLLPEDTDWGSVQITPSDTTNAFTGQMAGAKVKWAEGVTKVSGAEIKGLFDPVATTWKAVAQGAEMETGAFLAKVSSLDDAGKKAFMDATKIPAVQVGQATLSQASGTTVNNLSNVAMNNVGFYAYSTGAAPKIWATNNVSGSYSGTPSTSGLPANNVPLSGGGLNANFNVNQWNGSTWSATVAGSGALSSGSYNQPIQFTGGAAGAIQPATGSTGSFSGTGAGIAK
ncbi:MAG TPA: hypothetical protein PLE15_07545 [Smithellaceae bacterium]|nr:hypothetical protein [Smithellaceae bacterium]